jgi:hypothetical protein
LLAPGAGSERGTSVEPPRTGTREGARSIRTTARRGALVSLFERGGVWGRRYDPQTFSREGGLARRGGGIDRAQLPWWWDDWTMGGRFAREATQEDDPRCVKDGRRSDVQPRPQPGCDAARPRPR